MIDGLLDWGYSMLTTDNPLWAPAAGESRIGQIATAITDAPKAIAEGANKVGSAMQQGAEAIASNEWVARGAVWAIGGSCVLAGAAYAYRGLSQNCNLRNIIKNPMSLLPCEENEGNEQKSELTWTMKATSLAQRTALPVLTGVLPILVGAFICHQADNLVQMVRD